MNNPSPFPVDEPDPAEIAEQVERLMAAPQRFSLPWERQPDGTWKAASYSIVPSGSGQQLRYRGTLIHTGLSLTECQTEADRHRGVRRSA